MAKKKEEKAAAESAKQEQNTAPESKADAGAEAAAKEEALTKELAAANEKLLRLAAEYDNYRRRSQKEKEQSYSDAAAGIVTQLLPVLDNFDRALATTAADVDSYKKGMEMTAAQLTSVLSSIGLESFGEAGDEFDPTLHNAVMRVVSDELAEYTLAAVFSKGYRIGQRVLRCADVQVAN